MDTLRPSLRRRFLCVLTILAVCLLFFQACSYDINYSSRKESPERAAYVAQTMPDSIILLPAADPATMQTINWRTAVAVNNGVVRYRDITGNLKTGFYEKTATYTELKIPQLINDPINHRFSVTLQNLQPGHTYEYYVGSPALNKWSQRFTFTTADGFGEPFSFIFLGDIQKGIPQFKNLYRSVEERYPETKFFLTAGDLLQRGTDRNMWDGLFTDDLFARTMLVPALGNHELSRYKTDDDGPLLYFSYFNLPANGPRQLQTGRAYSFAYGDAYFFVLDSNEALELQKEWLERALAHPEVERYKWKIVMFHHPVYNIKEDGRSYEPDVQGAWQETFDEYGVDLVFNGHDHGYMRTHCLKNGVPAAQGTTYVVGVAGTKFYDLRDLPEAARMVEDTQTYQKIDIVKDENGETYLSYRAYDDDHELIDEFMLKK